ncbi:MAG: hypothetical protein ACRD5R_18805 [Candidatus Acidiferrales bacterium]
MFSAFHIVFTRNFLRKGLRVSLPVILLGLSMCISTLAQQAPPGAVGSVEGAEVSVENGTPSNPGTSMKAPSRYVRDGSVVTVHSGQAQLTFFSGGQIDICGPAKFTLLASGGAITVALNFGRVRVLLPAAATLRIFTPTIIATPLDIAGDARDITAGLDLNDSMCVRASSGALELEQQFTGEKLVIPEGQEFFLTNGKLAPVAGTPGSCQCQTLEAHAPVPQPIRENPEVASKPVILLEPPSVPAAENAAPPASPANVVASTPNIPAPPAEFAIPAKSNEAHPLPQAARNDAAEPPPSLPETRSELVAPILSFSTRMPVPPTRPSVDTMVLVREVQVQPDWEFKGHVAAPEFAQAMQHALGEQTAPPPQGVTSSQSSTQPTRKRGGFWGAFKKIFVGGS